jgi:ribosomal protein S18 acetylase RimI-like enzyme
MTKTLKSSLELITFLKFDKDRFIIPQSFIDAHKEQLMELEETCFKESIQEDWDSKQELIKAADVAVFAFNNSGIVGEAYVSRGDCSELNDDVDGNHLKDLFVKMDEEGAIYFMSFAILPEFQGKGIGERLLRKTINYCVDSGFKIVYAHAHKGVSSHLFEKVGGKFIEKRENWFDTGDTYLLYKMNYKAVA